MQTSGFNPLVFFVALLGFMIGFMFTIWWRIRKQPVPEKGSPDQTDEPVQ